MFKRLILILGCLLGVFSLTTSDEVPTIAISCGNTLLTTLPIYQQSIDTLEFTKLLSSFWNEHTKVVMVLEDELSLEDFTAKGNINTKRSVLFWICFWTIHQIYKIFY